MSKLRAVTIVAGPLMVLGTMAVGLRLGAEAPGVAAHVIAFPPPASGERLVWQVRTFREERRIRDPAAAQPFEITAKARDKSVRVSGVTNAEGIAEVDLELVAPPGTRVDVSVTASGDVLAQGPITVPEAVGSVAPSPAKPTKATGPGAIEVFAPPGGVAPSVENVVFVRVRSADPNVPVTKIVAEPEGGLEIPAPSIVPCPAGWAKLRVRGMSHTLAVNLTAESATGPVATWYGALPVVLGGDEVAVEPPAPRENAPFAIKVKSPTSKPVVYVELFDESGRAAAAPLELKNVGGFGEATLPVRGLAKGRYFAVVSSRIEGFLLGSAVARPFAIGDAPESATCEGEAQLALREPATLSRAVALDGFALRRSEAARTRQKGMTLAVASLAVGGMLAAVLLLGPLRKRDPLEAKGIARGATPRWVIAALLFGLSCLAYLLLAGLVLFSGN